MLAVICAAGAGAAAEEPARLPRLSVAVRVHIANASATTLECQALAARWYSFPMHRLAPGETAELDFAYAPARGDVTDPLSRLPVAMLYCGRAGEAWATRSVPDIQALAARAVAAGGMAQVVCTAPGGAPACALAK